MADKLKKLSRREREHLARRAEILEAANRLFASRGFHNTTMAEIAEAAEFATGTLYKFFTNKEELYFTLIEEKIEAMAAYIRQEMGQAEQPVSMIEKYVQAKFSFLEKERDFFKLYITEQCGFEWNIKDRLGERVHQSYLAHIEMLAGVLAEGIRAGEFKALDPKQMAHALAGLSNAFVFQWIINPQTESLEEKAPAVLEIFFRGVLA
jgi:AcrR family transcriptional regulator